MTMPLIDVILCTHNPRSTFLGAALGSLAGQTLSKDAWRLLIIDSGSKPSIQELISAGMVETHGLDFRLYREEESGLTRARIRGIREGTAELLVFLDDDNLLSTGFLSTALEVIASHPYIGAIGGRIEGVFERDPSDFVSRHESSLGIRSFEAKRWSNNYDLEIVPAGGGMVVTRKVCERYAGEVSAEGSRFRLDKKGPDFSYAGDVDMVLSANDLGLGHGVFPELLLYHQVPGSRMNRRYIRRSSYGKGKSITLLLHYRGLRRSTPVLFLNSLVGGVGKLLRFDTVGFYAHFGALSAHIEIWRSAA